VTDLKISEIFTSLQGEGPSAGTPCLFVRLALCNLHCAWCDTKYTWDFATYRFEEEVHLESVERVAERMRAAPEQRVVLTGGEPMLQQKALEELLALVPRTVFVEVETNGTQMPKDALLARVDQWNVSPKLSNAGDHERLRLKPAVLAVLAATGRAFLKLVVGNDHDLAEADALIAELAWPKERVLLMPEARTRAELERRSPAIAAACASRGLRFSTRLQLALFDGRRGV
jgi:7-carboxy-7-deazaguanine synthase